MKRGIGVFLELLKKDPGFYFMNFEHLEIQDFALPDNLDFQARYIINEYLELLKDFRGSLSLHGPFKELFPGSMDRRVQALAHLRFSQALFCGKELGCELIVVHSCYNPLFRYPGYEEEWLGNTERFWEKFLPLCRRENIKIALENIWDPSPVPIKRLLHKFDLPYFKACLDTGHAHLSSRLPLEKWLFCLREELCHLHIHDNFGLEDEHLPPGRGCIDFSALKSLPRNSDLALVSEAYGFKKEARDFLNFISFLAL